MSRRVVVTGMGAITPIGLSTEEFWQSVKEGKTGFAPITRFDTEGYKCHIAAEVKGFEGKNFMDFKAAKRMELFPNMQLQPPERRLPIPVWIWSRRTLTASVRQSAPASEACRQWSASTKSCWKKGRTASTRC